MKRRILCIGALFLILLLADYISADSVFASESSDESVQTVIEQLESIDTLQEMQNQRKNYSESIGYEDYISKMFAARLAAKEAYEALNAEQKSKIDAELVSKLNDTLENVCYYPTVSVTPRTDEYPYEVIFKNRIVYEIGHHVSAEMPCTIILVDTSQTGSQWTPNGLYEYGSSNYEVTYCCDSVKAVIGGTHYKRLNLEDSGYYSETSAKHIRAIVQASYPYLTLDEMKAGLKAGGLSSEFVDSLTRGDIISAVQMAIWAYANTDKSGVSAYAGTIEMTNNNIFYNPMHDYTNEIWSWWNVSISAKGIYDASAAYRVNNLVNYLCHLPGIEANSDQLVVSDVKITRAELISGANDTYNVGMRIYMNDGSSANDHLTITVTSYSENADGTTSVTGCTRQKMNEASEYGLFVNAKQGDLIQVVVEGTQYLEKGVYFYEPEGGREVSQCLVGMAEGLTDVKTVQSFVFEESVCEKGLRIYKTESSTGLPLSDITFSIYHVVPEADEVLSEIPTADELARYQTEDNKQISVTTDSTGYASAELSDGIYLIVEEHNSQKVVEPIEPFYISIPMQESMENADGSTTVSSVDIVSIYPKNEIIIPSDEKIVLPSVPDNVTGKFEILKHDVNDESIVLEGARFEVYRAASEGDLDVKTIVCEGVSYAVVPVVYDEQKLVLVTDEYGCAVSPELSCGTYFLSETKAPSGYNSLDEAVSVTIHSSLYNQTAIIKIANERGNILPETGGVGTTGFVVLGSILSVGAAVLLITKKRMNENIIE